MKRFFYRLIRRTVGLVARPTVNGTENVPATGDIIYVLHHRALTDLVVLDLALEHAGLISPLAPLKSPSLDESSRFFPLLRAAAGRMTMREQSPRMQRLVSADPECRQQILLIPTSVFWGRAMSGEGSLLKSLTSEHWAVTGRIKRFLNLFINRRNIIVHLGRPIVLAEVSGGARAGDAEPRLHVRKTGAHY